LKEIINCYAESKELALQALVCNQYVKNARSLIGKIVVDQVAVLRDGWGGSEFGRIIVKNAREDRRGGKTGAQWGVSLGDETARGTMGIFSKK
jgi:hypothetical protein